MNTTEDLKKLFLLNPDITYLNFGSFGATPTPIFDQYQAYQRALERDPVQFITVATSTLLKKSREALAEFIHCEAEDVVMVINPSYAVNTIAKSLNLQPGDEILTTNLEYGACDRVWDLICEQTGAKYVQQDIALPLTTEEIFIDALFSGVTNRTKLIFLSHITSATALIFPVEKVIKAAKLLGIPIFIDGAHVPGHIPLDIHSLDPDYYTGACHKWMMTPKGSSFMYVKKEHQPKIYPLAVSWGYKAAKPSASTYIDWHEMSGTMDYAARLCIPQALQFRKDYAWDQIAKQCRSLVIKNAPTFEKILGTQLLAPLDERFIGQMISVQIQSQHPELLYHTLVHEHKIEIPIMQHQDAFYMRYSIQGFNDQQDLDKLFEVIEIIKKTGLIMA
ncbi:MAG: aminotransferase class V-fold PLP-dependent enzyme [Chitinophagales bacterium]|nr:aminotransferase class V-fold PLP-dependent enzyme [Chitinophagales bacterium]